MRRYILYMKKFSQDSCTKQLKLKVILGQKEFMHKIAPSLHNRLEMSVERGELTLIIEKKLHFSRHFV